MRERKRHDRAVKLTSNLEEAIQRGYIPDGVVVPIPREWFPLSAVSLVKPSLPDAPTLDAGGEIIPDYW
ncbi:hypothetical protein LCGC14_1028760 [marine sediment metagenome]|uniref:Uncharacterized protein n=1 Tax=marine sediment metagenome TaxID=412755 RepID=A0A0F9R140_9ZZZZ